MDKKIIGIKVLNQEAQKIMLKIKEDNNFNSEYKVIKEKEHVIIPILKITENLKNFEKIEMMVTERQKKIGKGYKELLPDLKENVVKELPNSYDIVGDILIINIENKRVAEKYAQEIGKALTTLHPHIKTVLNKEKEHHGLFRTQDLKFLYGENKTETMIKENKCILKSDVEKVFYSTRLSTERKRIASLVKDGEVVGVFFAGVGPFAIQIAKLAKPKEVIAIELNPMGVKYLRENIVLNKMEKKIKGIEGDVKKVSREYPNYFDRIPMPLPKSAEDFLEDAIFSIKNGGIVHIYNFVPKNEPFKEIMEVIKEKEKKNNCKIEIVYKKVIRDFSATTVQIVMDLKIKKN